MKLKEENKVKKGILAKGTQVLLTGKPITQTQAEKVIEFCNLNQFYIQKWCSLTGNLGHIDGLIKSFIKLEEVLEQSEELARKFPFLDLGITVMNGKVGSYVQPMISFNIKNGILKIETKGENVHLLHPPPKRIYKK